MPGRQNSYFSFLASLVFILLMVSLLGACSTPQPLDADTADNLNKIASGPATGESKTVSTQPSVAASYMGDAHAEAVDVKGATVQHTNTASGHTVVGFSFAASMTTLQEAMAEASKESPTMRALQAQLDRLLAATPPDEAGIAAVIVQIREEENNLRTALAKSGGDLSNLTHLTQVFTVLSANGANNPMSDAQADAIGGAMAPTVVAARGGTVTSKPEPAPKSAEDGGK